MRPTFLQRIHVDFDVCTESLYGNSSIVLHLISMEISSIKHSGNQRFSPDVLFSRIFSITAPIQAFLDRL